MPARYKILFPVADMEIVSEEFLGVKAVGLWQQIAVEEDMLVHK